MGVCPLVIYLWSSEWMSLYLNRRSNTRTIFQLSYIEFLEILFYEPYDKNNNSFNQNWVFVLWCFHNCTVFCLIFCTYKRTRIGWNRKSRCVNKLRWWSNISWNIILDWQNQFLTRYHNSSSFQHIIQPPRIFDLYNNDVFLYKKTIYSSDVLTFLNNKL